MNFAPVPDVFIRKVIKTLINFTYSKFFVYFNVLVAADFTNALQYLNKKLTKFHRSDSLSIALRKMVWPFKIPGSLHKVRQFSSPYVVRNIRCL